jgi:2-methylcitrate dehydratase PrpD
MVKDMVGMPFSPGENPQVSAQFSIPYTVSTALVKGDVFLEDFETNAISDEQRNALARKVEVTTDKGLADNDIHIARISLLTSGSKIFHYEVDTPPGNPKNPLSEKILKEKFCKCVRYKRNGIREDELERLINTVDRLEELDDVSTIAEMMCGNLV